MSISDDKFYAQRDANFKERVCNILFDDSSAHSDEEVLELINKLSYKLEDEVNNEEKTIDYRGNSYAENVDALVARMGSGWH